MRQLCLRRLVVQTWQRSTEGFFVGILCEISFTALDNFKGITTKKRKSPFRARVPLHGGMFSLRGLYGIFQIAHKIHPHLLSRA